MRPLPSLFCLFICLPLLLSSTTTNAHNITRILAKHPEFSTFNHYLSATHLASEINRRLTITVCAVDNAAMNDILAKHLSVYQLRNVLALHIFADYFGAKKLHQIPKSSTQTATLFQATGKAAGTSGYVNITDIKGGRVGFSPVDNSGTINAVFVKSIDEIPYNISVIQISHILSSPEAEAPTAGPSDINVTSIMSKQGCKVFADLLRASSEAEDTFAQSVEGGLTVFCPTDDVINGFMPKYKNLTAAGKVSLLLYHGFPTFNSLGMLRSSNGLMNTLATDGANKYDLTVQNDGEDVKLETKVVTATIKGTLVDEEPLAVFKIDKILLPRELFKAEPPAPAPKGSKNKKSSDGGAAADADAEVPGPASDDEDPADQTANDNGSVRVSVSAELVLSVVLSLCIGGALPW